jgi:hypothetical protein
MKTHINALLIGTAALSLTAFAFEPKMTLAQIEKEIADRLQQHQQVQTIATASTQAGVAAPVVIGTLLSQSVPVKEVVCGAMVAGISYDTVISASMAGGANATAVYRAATSCGVTAENATQALILAGVDPTQFAEGTAAGPGTGGGANPVGSTAPSFFSSPASTVGGGGGGAASRS